MNELESILDQAERKQERIAALLRFVVFMSLLIAVLSVRRKDGHELPLLAATLAYGALSVAGLWLAWRDVYSRWVPYAFVTGEVLLVVALIVMMGRILAIPHEVGAVVPVAGLVFVILAHAAMRYRPWLIVYGAGLFVVALGLARLVFGSPETPPMANMEHGAGMEFHHFFYYEVFPAVTLILTTFILFVTARGTRRLLHQSLDGMLKVSRLSRFFSTEVARSLAEDADEMLMRGGRRSVAVLFADIRGFTGLAEQMDPETLGRFVSDFRERLVRIVEARGGAVDKFVGDAVMAVFGIPERRDDDARRALDCARDMIESMAAWSAEREKIGRPVVSVGIGVYYGEVFAGILGRDRLLEFTVIGDTVNVAERLERLTRSLQADIAVSTDLMKATGQALSAPPWESVRDCRISGRDQTLDVFYVPVGILAQRPEARSANEARQTQSLLSEC